MKKSKGSSINIIDRIKTAITGRKILAPNARKTLEKYGNDRIVKIVIHRKPLQYGFSKIVKILSGGVPAYDTLFHLYMIITTDKNIQIQIEKIHVINISTSITPQGSINEFMEIPINKIITLNELIENTKKYMGNKFLIYSAENANCQNFINSILISNGLNNEFASKFINQDSKEIFSRLPRGLSKVLDYISEFFQRVDVLIHGKGKNKKKKMSKERFNELNDIADRVIYDF